MSEPLTADCPICQKPGELCVCAEAEKIDNRIEVLILQHPQEQDKTLGTARLLAHQLSRAQLKVGLSWPSLAKALGRDAEPRRWAVLYLGSAKPAPGREIEVQDAKGAVIADQDRGMAGIEGVVVLDGTWSQAKALWWRNPWVLKCKRIVLAPPLPSAYGRLRREPRREGLSTIEAVGLLLGQLERRPEIDAALSSGFRRMLERFRQSSHCRPAGKQERKPDRRRHSA